MPKNEGVRVRNREKAEDKEEPSAVVKGGAKAPSSYSHSLGIWMSRQGLHRRRGHKYRSATAIFPAVPAARHSRPDSAQAPAGPEGRGLVGSLGREPGVGALGQRKRDGWGRREERTDGG